MHYLGTIKSLIPLDKTMNGKWKNNIYSEWQIKNIQGIFFEICERSGRILAIKAVVDDNQFFPSTNTWIYVACIIPLLYVFKRKIVFVCVLSPAGCRKGVGHHLTEAIRLDRDKKKKKKYSLVHPRCHHSMLMSQSGAFKCWNPTQGPVRRPDDDTHWRQRGEYVTEMW